ncbi:MAG: hypothetical protein NTV86_00950 [Planctomycetota bacterium]|nr:hypothetical protein [Planctomycetota bacterium]
MPRGVAFEPHHVAIQGANLTVFASNGQPIWSIGLDGTIAKAEVTRLFSDKGNYVVVGVGGNGKDGGKVLVYDAGGELVWDRRTDLEPYPYRGGTANRMRIEDVVVADLWQTGSPNIVTISNDLDWYASKVSVFDRTGMLKRIYWHPGQLRKAITFKPTNGGRLRILVFGCNNHMRVAVPGSDMVLNYTGIACLDPETLSGEAPPRRGTIGRGTELWYGLLFPQSLTINEIKVLPPAPGAPEGTSGGTIQACLSNCCFLYLDEDGKCVKVAHGGIHIPDPGTSG